MLVSFMIIATTVISGPRNKTEATRKLEELVKLLLATNITKRCVAINYNQQQEMIIHIGKQQYNLTAILSQQPDWQQLQFEAKDIWYYKQFLNQPHTKYRHLNTQRSQELRIKKIRQCFPNLTLVECSAISNYTTELYTIINPLLRSEAKIQFPNPQTLVIGEMKSALEQFIVNEQLDLKQLVMESLLTSAIAASALSKPIQEQQQVYLAKSMDDLQSSMPNIQGTAIVILGQGDKRQIAYIAYGKILAHDPSVEFSINKLVEESQMKISFSKFNLVQRENDLTKFSVAEKIKLLKILHTTASFERLTADSIQTRLLARLGSLIGSQHLHPCEILYRADNKNETMQKHFANIQHNIEQTGASKNVTQGFYSSSTKLLKTFFQNNNGIVTRINNPVGFGKNISSLAVVNNEEERLFLPNQEVIYSHFDTVDGNDVYTAHMTRGLSDITEPKSKSPMVATIKEKHSLSLFSKLSIGGGITCAAAAYYALRNVKKSKQ